MSELRVGLIDADDSVRMGRSLLLNSQPNIDIVLESADPVASLDSLPDYLIDVLVIDARVPGMTIAEYLTKLNAALLDSGNQMRVIVSCTSPEPQCAGHRTRHRCAWHPHPSRRHPLPVLRTFFNPAIRSPHDRPQRAAVHH